MPTAVLAGASSFEIPNDPEPMLSVSASVPSQGGYQLVVYDRSDNNRIVATCSSSGSSCEFGIYPDYGARVPIVHHLEAETQSAGVKVADGDTLDVTVNPFPVRAKIKLVSELHDKDGGGAIVRIWNADGNGRAVPGYSISLERRTPPERRWTTVARCAADLGCKLGVALSDATYPPTARRAPNCAPSCGTQAAWWTQAPF